MKKAIIHISDLHVTSHLNPNGQKKDELDSYLNTDNTDGFRDSFLLSILNYIKNEYNDTELYLLVTGDISDSGKKIEFETASNILSEFSKELSISKNNILLVPGDHDVNWSDCTHMFENKNPEGKLAYEFHKEKFEKYTAFYNEFFYTHKLYFDPEKAVCGVINLGSKSMVIGLNSNFRIGAMQGEGFIDLPKLKYELEEIIKINIGKHIFVSFHHNMEAKHENKSIGNWDVENLQQVKTYLLSKDIKVFFYGNEHTSFSEEEVGILFQSAVSSLSKKDQTPSFKIYEINDTDGYVINNKLFNYQRQGSPQILSKGYWAPITNSPQEKNNFIIAKTNTIESTENSQEIVELPNKVITLPNQMEQFDMENGNNIKSNEGLQKKMESVIKVSSLPVQKEKGVHYDQLFLNLIREKKLFHSGHFHWSDTSRAHNWIDVTKILNSHTDIELAKNAIIDQIENNINIGNVDVVIGLGIEGTILSTRVAWNYNKPYSFLPYSYRYEDHNDSEKNLDFKNLGEIKSVLIITDVVNDGRTIRNLIHKKEGNLDKFFNRIKSIYVVSLFYTGGVEDKNPYMLNLKKEQIIKEKILGDYVEERIEFYYVLDLKVDKCPYKQNYKQECIILKENLSCIHRFYNES
jgi:orotate phosphoribosyltransferase